MRRYVFRRATQSAGLLHAGDGYASSQEQSLERLSGGLFRKRFLQRNKSTTQKEQLEQPASANLHVLARSQNQIKIKLKLFMKRI